MLGDPQWHPWFLLYSLCLDVINMPQHLFETRPDDSCFHLGKRFLGTANLTSQEAGLLLPQILHGVFTMSC